MTATTLGNFNFSTSTQFFPRTLSSLPVSCVQGEYVNLSGSTTPPTEPYLCANTNNWYQFPLFDLTGNLTVASNLNVGPTTDTGSITFYSGGTGTGSVALAAPANSSATGTVTVPIGTANMLTDSLQASVSHKTLQDGTGSSGVQFVNATDPTIKFAVNLAGASTTTAATLAFRQAANITVTAPAVTSTLGGTVEASAATGDTVNDKSGAGNAQAFSQTYSFPAALLGTNRILRVTGFFSLTSTLTSGFPTLQLVLQFGGTDIAATAAVQPDIAFNGMQGSATWQIQGTAAPSSSASVQTGAVINIQGFAPADANPVAQPVTANTSAAGTLDIVAVWSAVHSGTTSITLQQLLVEALN